MPSAKHNANTCARCLAQHLSPTLGVELVERAYGEDCRPLYRNVRCDLDAAGFAGVALTPCGCRAMIMDEFVIAHTVGWWAKALMLRHSGMYARSAPDRRVRSVSSCRIACAPQALGRLHSFRALGALLSGAFRLCAWLLRRRHRQSDRKRRTESTCMPLASAAQL